MSAWDKLKKVLKASGGFVVGAVSVFTWLNVTPAMVGQAAFNVLYASLPVVTFIGGALSGWGITKLWSEKVISDKDNECRNCLTNKDNECEKKLAKKDEEIKRVVEEHTASFLDLQTRQLSAIFYCVARGGTVSVPSDSELVRELQALKRMGYADTVDGSGQGSYWFVTDRTLNIIRNSEECSALLDEAALVGRFSDDGRYIVTPPDVADFVRSKLKEE